LLLTSAFFANKFKKRHRAINAEVVITFILASGDVPAQPLPPGDAMFAYSFAFADVSAAVNGPYPEIGLMLSNFQCVEFRPVL